MMTARASLESRVCLTSYLGEICAAVGIARSSRFSLYILGYHSNPCVFVALSFLEKFQNNWLMQLKSFKWCWDFYLISVLSSLSQIFAQPAASLSSLFYGRFRPKSEKISQSRGCACVTFYQQYHYETGMTQQLIWYMTQTIHARFCLYSSNSMCNCIV